MGSDEKSKTMKAWKLRAVPQSCRKVMPGSMLRMVPGEVGCAWPSSVVVPPPM